MDLLAVGLERREHCSVGGRLPIAVDAADAFGQHRIDTAQALAQRLAPRQHVADVVGARCGQGALVGAHLLVELGETPCELPLAPAELAVLLGRAFEPGPQVGDLASDHVHPQRRELGDQVAVATRRVSLTFERLELTPDLTQEILETGQVGLGGLEASLALLLATPVLEDTGGFLDDRPSILGPGVEDGVDLALRDDDVLLATHAAVAEELLDVEQTAGDAVDLVLAVAGAEEAAGDSDLVELDRHDLRRVVEGDRHLGPAQRLLPGRAGEDDIVHLLGAHGGGPLGAEYPRHRIDDVGLAAAVGADDDGHTGFEVESRGVRERLEPLEREGLQKHNRPNLATRFPPVAAHCEIPSSGWKSPADGQTWDWSQ